MLETIAVILICSVAARHGQRLHARQLHLRAPGHRDRALHRAIDQRPQGLTLPAHDGHAAEHQRAASAMGERFAKHGDAQRHRDDRIDVRESDTSETGRCRSAPCRRRSRRSRRLSRGRRMRWWCARESSDPHSPRNVPVSSIIAPPASICAVTLNTFSWRPCRFRPTNRSPIRDTRPVTRPCPRRTGARSRHEVRAR